MSTKQERIDLLVDEKRVKLHLFNPSKREIWTVVGKAKEHWIDPDSEYCSCSGYYFGMIKNKKPCYHLESIFKAKKENKAANKIKRRKKIQKLQQLSIINTTPLTQEKA